MSPLLGVWRACGAVTYFDNDFTLQGPAAVRGAPPFPPMKRPPMILTALLLRTCKGARRSGSPDAGVRGGARRGRATFSTSPPSAAWTATARSPIKASAWSSIPRGRRGLVLRARALRCGGKAGWAGRGCGRRAGRPMGRRRGGSGIRDRLHRASTGVDQRCRARPAGARGR